MGTGVEEVERQTNSPPWPRPHNRDRYIIPGLGCSGQWGEHRGPVVRGRTSTAYQLLGDDGGSASSAELCKEHGAEAHTAEDGQPGGNCLCQPLGRNEIPLTVVHSMPAMGMVPPERDNSLCRTPARVSQRGGRSRVSDSSVLGRVETSQLHIPKGL